MLWRTAMKISRRGALPRAGFRTLFEDLCNSSDETRRLKQRDRLTGLYNQAWVCFARWAHRTGRGGLDGGPAHADAPGPGQLQVRERQVRRRQDIETALKIVKPDAEFRLVYMPLLNVKTGELDGFEAQLQLSNSTEVLDRYARRFEIAPCNIQREEAQSSSRGICPSLLALTAR